MNPDNAAPESIQPGNLPPSTQGPVFSGLSGNEMYCAAMLDYRPGDILVGNSVFSLGFIGGIGSGLRTFVGGEVKQFTEIIAEGRRLSLQRFGQELAQIGGSGASGVTSELIFHPGNIEFLTVGSTLHAGERAAGKPVFTTSSDAQELLCQSDAGYQPISFVFGNVAYSIGVGRGIMGGLRQLAKGEVKEYSEIFNATRNLALERIVEEARQAGANSVVGIRTTILPLQQTSGVQEMVMIGTASHNPQVASIVQNSGITTSDLTAEETWNIAQLGYAPIKLVLGTSVYSLGLAGGIKAALRNFVKGEIKELTQIIYDARESALQKVQAQAAAVGADDVLGIKTYIYNIGNGVIEFLAIGTAVKRISGLETKMKQLPPQAIIRDKDTFINTAELSFGVDLGLGAR